MRLGKKGFYVATPVIGAIIFLISALIASNMLTENNIRIEVARGSTNQDRLEFMSQAIVADSYDVILQLNLEQLTTQFIENEYHAIDADSDESWRYTFKNNMLKYFEVELGESLGMNIEAYKKAYENTPGIEYCKVGSEGGYSRPDIDDTIENDGTIQVRAESYGESIVCVASEPPAELKIDILGRAYRINIRAKKLYEKAKEILILTETAIRQGTADIREPVAEWQGSRWAPVSKIDNTITDDGRVGLQNIIDASERSWIIETTRVINDVKRIMGEQTTEGIQISELEILNEDGLGYDVGDLDISCVEDSSRTLRNCMPYKVRTVIGDSNCMGGGSPLGSETDEFLKLKNLDMRCDGNVCPPEAMNTMKDILRPLDSLCADYYANVDAVVPVCKKWEGKGRSLEIRGVIEDNDRRYTTTGKETNYLKFKDHQPNTNTDEIKKSRLTCQMFTDDDDTYYDNVRAILENLRIRIGNKREANLYRWTDIGSSISNVGDQLKEIYEDIYGLGTLPIPCFISGVAGKEGCREVERPKIELELDWAGVKQNCIDGATDLCRGICGGTVNERYKEGFCNSLFPSAGTSIGEGVISCMGGNSCEDVKIQLFEIELEHRI